MRIGRVTWMPGYSNTGWNVETHNGVRENWDLYELKKHPFSIEYRKMAVLEGLKVKFSCFKGIVQCAPNPLPIASGLGNLTRQSATFVCQIYTRWQPIISGMSTNRLRLLYIHILVVRLGKPCWTNSAVFLNIEHCRIWPNPRHLIQRREEK